MMDDQNVFKNAINQIENARIAVERAQANPQGYQEAQQLISLAYQLLQKAQLQSAYSTEEQKRDLQHANELLRHLEEAQHSLQ